MVNEEKVRIMTDIAKYESHEGKKYLPISKFYRRDYIGLALIKNFFLVTIGYGIIILSLGAYYGEYLLNNIHRMDLVSLGIQILIGYGVVVGAYTVFTYIQCTVKYILAKKSVKRYYNLLTQLNKFYIKNERRNQRRQAGGK